MTDIKDDFQAFIDSFGILESGTYPLGKIFKETVYGELVINKLKEKLKITEHGFCYPIMTSDSDILCVYTLIEVSMLDHYTKVIPEHGFNYTCDLTKISTSNLTETIEITNYNVLVNLQKTVFEKSNITSINYPEDYFLKGIPLWTEELSKQFLSHSENKKGLNENYSAIRSLTLKKIIG